MTKEVKKGKKEYKPKYPEVDVHNDALMIREGIRQPHVKPRDPQVWSKTPHEKEILRTYRNRDYEFVSSGAPKKNSIPVYGKLIIYIEPNDSYKVVHPKTGVKSLKTTFSIKCGQSDIPSVLARYPKVTKYSWNGKTYRNSELPFWYGKSGH